MVLPFRGGVFVCGVGEGSRRWTLCQLKHGFHCCLLHFIISCCNSFCTNGLFTGDEYTTLMTQCKEGAQREGLMLDSNEELYKWFTGQVMRNLHVVFTMNPSSEGLKDRAATSPALFNRCVLNWFGDWSDGALFQVYLMFDL